MLTLTGGIANLIAPNPETAPPIVIAVESELESAIDTCKSELNVGVFEVPLFNHPPEPDNSQSPADNVNEVIAKIELFVNVPVFDEVRNSPIVPVAAFEPSITPILSNEPIREFDELVRTQ